MRRWQDFHAIPFFIMRTVLGFVMEECGLVWKSFREHKCSVFGISVVQCEDLVSHLKRAINRVTLYSNHY